MPKARILQEAGYQRLQQQIEELKARFPIAEGPLSEFSDNLFTFAVPNYDDPAWNNQLRAELQRRIEEVAS